MNPRTAADALASSWVAAWNSHDLARILDHYTDDFEITSSYAISIPELKLKKRVIRKKTQPEEKTSCLYLRERSAQSAG
jgi:hypothetical protein